MQQTDDVSNFLGNVRKELINQETNGETLEITLNRAPGALTVTSSSFDFSSGIFSVVATVGEFHRTWSKGVSCFSRNALADDILDDSDEQHSGAAALAKGNSNVQWRVQRHQGGMRLSVPLPFGGSGLELDGFAHALNAWVSVGMKTLAGAAVGSALPLLLNSASGTSGALSFIMPLKVSGFVGTDFLMTGLTGLGNHAGILSLASAMMFIGSIRGLSQHSTAQQGNMLGMTAAALGVLSVFVAPSFSGAHGRFLATVLLASGVGLGAAKSVSMEEMPQLVAGFHSFVGLGAVFCGLATYFASGGTFEGLKALETFLGTSVGMLTFTGSVVAAAKLQELIPGKPYILEKRWTLNGLAILGSTVLGAAFMNESIYTSQYLGTGCLLANSVIWGGLGINMVLPIGGADMPVVVSLLNAFSGIATSAAGFLLNNNLLTITGALVASSGCLLSDIMCKGINRSMYNVLLGGFGTDPGTVLASSSGGPAGTVQEVSSDGFAGMLLSARRVLVVPGYGMAVARCQNKLADIVEMLREHGVVVHFAIHPVAGRLPGHMNVLLAEASVPHDIVKEMDDVNKEIKSYDIALVVGANDIINPATQDDPSSPIYGMPAIEVWESTTCIVMKRSMATGYSGVDNPLFYRDNVKMLFGNAKASLDHVFTVLEERQDSFRNGGGVEDPNSPSEVQVVEENYPPACKVVGIIKERRTGEQRVGISPSVVKKMRHMGFSILLEAGAGVGAGFADEDFIRFGGVQVAESAVEVLQQADVVLKVNEPSLDEVQMLKTSQTMIAFWAMDAKGELMSALERSPATFVNLALVPRISRAQKLDALTSMANIAGYRAVLDAFGRLPRFSRSSVTACGAVAPAKVFIIGAGIAGLSAIATAHAMGAKVLANDVRDAAREQVEGLGAEFVPVDAVGIAGEGVGGYATEVGEAFTQAQLATYARIVKDCDVVITTALIPNRAAPTLITKDMIASMRKGSVIIDLAASAGGNCALTREDEVVTSSNGIIVVGETNYPSQMGGVASDMIGHNFAAMLDTLGGATEFGGDKWEDPIIRPATVMRDGKKLWPPPRPPAPPAKAAAPAPAPAPGAASSSTSPPAAMSTKTGMPDSVAQLLAWIEDHKTELAFGVGAAVILGMGFSAEIPDEVVNQLGYFVLSCLIGHFTVAGVNPALHTPLISVTNAISGVIVVGGMLQLNGPLLSAKVGCALAAVFLSTVNVVGGFAVTQRMLEMFREDKAKIKARAGGRVRAAS